MAETTVAQKAATLDSQITGGTYAAPPTPAHTAILACLRTAGILTPAGAYVNGKGLTDVQNALSTPEVRHDLLWRSGIVIGL